MTSPTLTAELKPNVQHLLDVIVPAYNNPDITLRCVSSLLLFLQKNERIVLVDNGSQDEGIAAIGKLIEPMGHKFVRIEKNRGPYGAVNVGLEQSNSMLVAVVCNDAVVFPDTFRALISSLRPELGVPIVGAQEPSNLGEFNFFNTLECANACGLGPARLRPAQGYFTCFVAFRSLFDDNAVGKFDEQFDLTFGDTDWEERLKLSGLHYMRADHAIVHHGHSVTRKRQGVEEDFRINNSDHLKFIAKWKDNPDVMARHGGLIDEESYKRVTGQIWQKVGDQ